MHCYKECNQLVMAVLTNNNVGMFWDHPDLFGLFVIHKGTLTGRLGTVMGQGLLGEVQE